MGVWKEKKRKVRKYKHTKYEVAVTYKRWG